MCALTYARPAHGHGPRPLGKKMRAEERIIQAESRPMRTINIADCARLLLEQPWKEKAAQAPAGARQALNGVIVLSRDEA